MAQVLRSSPYLVYMILVKLMNSNDPSYLFVVLQKFSILPNLIFLRFHQNRPHRILVLTSIWRFLFVFKTCVYFLTKYPDPLTPCFKQEFFSFLLDKLFVSTVDEEIFKEKRPIISSSVFVLIPSKLFQNVSHSIIMLIMM